VFVDEWIVRAGHNILCADVAPFGVYDAAFRPGCFGLRIDFASGGGENPADTGGELQRVQVCLSRESYRAFDREWQFGFCLERGHNPELPRGAYLILDLLQFVFCRGVDICVCVGKVAFDLLAGYNLAVVAYRFFVGGKVLRRPLFAQAFQQSCVD
jgi:hypothetical protein